MTVVPSLALEKTIGRAIDFASERRHEFVTLEHLLLALAEDSDAVEVLRACDVDLGKLREDLCNYLDNDLDYLVTDTTMDPRPTEGFNRALQRAMIHVQSSGREDVTGANVLVAIFSERESHAVNFLQEQDMTRFDAVNYISHGVAKVPGLSETRGLDSVDLSVERSQDLETTFRRAVDLAIRKRHQDVTLEHLLMALTEDLDAVAVVHACNVNLEALRSDLLNYLDKHLDYLVVGSLCVPRMTTSVVHVLKRAARETESAGKGVLTGADLLLAIFSEEGSFAVYFLRERNMTASDVIRHTGGRPTSGETP
jgi:ATP-dependent Clp protease ATP-binding subunit ClpA